MPTNIYPYSTLIFTTCPQLPLPSLAQALTNTKTSNALVLGNRTEQCGFQGNSDIYGIRIRMGYYTQALSLWFSKYFVLSESKVLRSVNLLFTIALFIGLAWLSHTPSNSTPSKLTSSTIYSSQHGVSVLLTSRDSVASIGALVSLC